MARKRKKHSKPSLRRRLLRWALRGVAVFVALIVVWVLAYRVINPPTTPYIVSEWQRTGEISRDWRPLSQMSADLPRSAVAAEDANFCLHWGFDLTAIREAIADGAERGASTITQQTVKNVFLWHGRSWVRKAFETALTPLVEALWPKDRILEVYLNVAEFGDGVFGVEAAAQAAFGKPARDLTATEAARLAAVLPNPKNRSASNPSAQLRQRSAAIADGAATIERDGRAACFES